MIRKDKNVVSSALFGVAMIQAIPNLLGCIVYGPILGAANWIITFSFVAFIVLAVVARRARIPAAVIAAFLYGSFLVFQACISAELLTVGLIFKIPIVLLLIVALAVAFKGERAAGQGKNTQQPMDA